MQLHLIFSRSRNGVIGHNNSMPWHLPEDLAHFKRATLGCPVIMGRKTWDSLPAKFRPLPGRSNIVITRQSDWCASETRSAEGTSVVRAADLPSALQLCAAAPVAWIIGGAQIYAQAEPLAQRAVVTEIDLDVPGDAFAPSFGPQWVETQREELCSAQGLRYRFITLEKQAFA
jgi:dihydrofolate reductase